MGEPTAAGTGVTPTTVQQREVEVFDAGRWRGVSGLVAGDTAVYLTGRRLRIAIVRDEDYAPSPLTDPEAWLTALRNWCPAGRTADLFAFSQRLPDTAPSFAYPWEPMSVAALKLGTFDQWLAAVPRQTRQNVRRAERLGVEIKIQRLDDVLLRGIQAVNDESLVVQGKSSRFYGKTLAQVWKDQQRLADRSWYLCAYHAGKLIGYMKIVDCGASACVLSNLTRPSHADKRPANAILAGAVRLCVEEKIPYLVYGQLNYGNKRGGTLREFKLRNGFSEILVPRYYVPLTPRGRLALRLGLHRGPLGMLPPWAIRGVLGSAERWRRLRTRQESRSGAMVRSKP